MPAEKIIQLFPAEKPGKPINPVRKKAARHSSGLVAKHFRYWDVYGNPKQKTVYGKTATEAQRKKDDFLAAVKQGLRMEEQGRTVASWAEEWLTVYKRNVGHKTKEGYAHAIRLINSAISNKPLQSVTQADLQKIINTRQGLSASSINKVAITIKSIFNKAAENRLIPYSPAIGLSIPKGSKGTHRALSPDEVSAIVSACQAGHRLSSAIMLMLFAGLRKGEAAAFNFDTDVSDNKLNVSRALEWPVNQAVVKLPKSDAGTRSIPIMPPLVVGEGYALDNGLISKTSIAKSLKSFIALCGVKFSFHDLRHTYATMLYDAGVDVKTAQAWLGHSDPSVTMRIYTHLSSQRQEASVSLAEDYFAQF